MKIIPVADRILVERIKEKEKVGSIHIPETAKEPSQVGLVVAVGPGRLPDGPTEVCRVKDSGDPGPALETVFEDLYRYAKPICESGDKVMFGRFSGVEIKANQTTYFLLRQDEIIAIVEAEDEELTDVTAEEVGE